MFYNYNSINHFDNSFNLSINSAINDNTIVLTLVNYVNLWILINSLIYNIYDNYVSNNIKYENKIKECQNIIKLNDIDFPIRNKDLLKLLDTKSLERQIILYYIFKMHGQFTSDTYVNSYENIIENNDTNIYNSYYEYHFWSNIYGGCDKFNLDETLPHNYMIFENGEQLYECNRANINFLYWLKYSGLYDYIFSESNIHIKKYILDQMNKQKLISGNNFIKYQLFLIEYEELFSKDIFYLEEEDEKDNNSYGNCKNDCENDCDCNGDGDCNDCNDYSDSDIDSEEEYKKDQTNKITRVLCIDDIDKYVFLEDLKYSFYNICNSIYNKIFNISE